MKVHCVINIKSSEYLQSEKGVWKDFFSKFPLIKRVLWHGSSAGCTEIEIIFGEIVTGLGLDDLTLTVSSMDDTSSIKATLLEMSVC